MRLSGLALIALLMSVGVANAAPKLGGQTHLSYSPGHGTQVEFLKADGTNYLWYPGNRIVLPGNWKVEGKDICFRYGANSYNPVTKQGGGGWECEPLSAYWGVEVEQAKGDVFGLAKKQKVPFDLPPARTTIAALSGGKGKSQPNAGPAAVSNIPECQQVLDHANDSKDAMLSAGLLYYHGKWMGKKCVDVDYIRAFELLRQSGDTRNAASLMKDLRQKAASGNPKAVAALEKLE